MKIALTKIEEMWNDGVRIYDNFASQFEFIYSTPPTKILELISVLNKKKEKELLLRVMMNEYISNLSDEGIILRNKKLYSVSDKLTIK